MASSKPDVLTTAKQHAEIMNRLNMAVAKHSNLKFFKRSRPSATNSQPSTPSSADGPASKKNKTSGFSSLAKTTTAAGTGSTQAPSSSSSSTKANTRSSRADQDDPDSDFGSLTAGVGYAPPGTEAAAAAEGTARSAETRDLRGKLLGKRAREQREEGAAARKRRSARDESSDEEEGRSGIGKGRKGKGKKAAKD